MVHMSQAPRNRESQVGVTAFKARCLSLIDDVAAGRKSRVLLTKRGKAIAAVVPLSGKKGPGRDLWGALRGTVKIPKGADLTAPTGEVWNAEIE